MIAVAEGTLTNQGYNAHTDDYKQKNDIVPPSNGISRFISTLSPVPIFEASMYMYLLKTNLIVNLALIKDS